MYKKYCHCTLEDRIEIVIRVLERHRDYKSQTSNSLGFLTGVAGIRFAISEIASIHHFLFSTESTEHVQLLVARLMQQAHDICVSTRNPNNLLGPAIFLLKMIVRQFGFPCLTCVSEEYEWVIPVCLRTKDVVCYCVIEAYYSVSWKEEDFGCNNGFMLVCRRRLLTPL